MFVNVTPGWLGDWQPLLPGSRFRWSNSNKPSSLTGANNWVSASQVQEEVGWLLVIFFPFNFVTSKQTLDSSIQNLNSCYIQIKALFDTFAFAHHARSLVTFGDLCFFCRCMNLRYSVHSLTSLSLDVCEFQRPMRKTQPGSKSRWWRHSAAAVGC